VQPLTFLLLPVKVEVKLPLCMDEGMEVWCHSFLIFALEGGEWSPSCPGAVTAIPSEQEA